jgi:hypothetical protein
MLPGVARRIPICADFYQPDFVEGAKQYIQLHEVQSNRLPKQISCHGACMLESHFDCLARYTGEKRSYLNIIGELINLQAHAY